MMIAIVILGLGLVMVATMFPVAWDRARTLNDYTVEQSAAAGAQATLATLLRPAGHSLVIRDPNTPPYEEMRLTSGSLAGDMFFDPTLPKVLPVVDGYLALLAFADTSVHALNVENLPFVSPAGPTPVGEDPWDLEDPGGSFPTPLTQIVQDRFQNLNNDYPLPAYQRNRGEPFPDRLFYTPQVRVWQRLYPPMEAPPADPAAPGYSEQLNQWNEKLATRRFCWAVLHRLRSQVGPTPLSALERVVQEAAAAMGSTRTFDMYYVTLRRSKPTNRYARQDAADPARIPNPFTLTAVPVEPRARVAVDDVMFPLAWRVQMGFSTTLAPAVNATGVPTEVPVPPTDASGQPLIMGEPARMLVQMFPARTQFIDEITGNLYRVSKRRIVDDKGEKSVLTLDREIVVEDFDMPPGDPRCGIPDICLPVGALVAPELLRTVWVFPPPVDRSQSPDEQTPLFDGPSPVVDIEVGSLSISPSS